MWTNLEHHVWKLLKENSLESEELFLLAVSGGVDSVVLSQVFQKIKPQGRHVLMYFHHGEGENQAYRDQCFELLRQKSGFIFETEQALDILKSENDFRQARQAFFEKMKRKYQKTYYVTAHHMDDVLETRLLKLIRGAGAEGLAAFQAWNTQILRPFLEIEKKVIKEYAQENQLSWCEDPSNEDPQYLRNWIRHQWLPALEQRAPGGVQNFAQSLQNIISNRSENRYETESARYVICKNNEVSMDRAWLMSFTTKDQLSLLIRVIKGTFACDISMSQAKEVLRRLQSQEKNYKFNVAGINWVIQERNIVLNYRNNKAQ